MTVWVVTSSMACSSRETTQKALGGLLTILCEVTPAATSNANEVYNDHEASIAAGTVEIWRADLDAHASSLLHMISPEELAQSARFREEVHRNRYIQAHGLLRLLISRYTAIAPRFISLSVNAFGKPFLKNDQNILGLQFNMSHSGGMAAYAFSLDCSVGVDIEHVRDDNELIALAHRYFARAEHEELCSLSDSCRMQHFFQLWTRKEACMKAKGTGLSLELLREPSLAATADGVEWKATGNITVFDIDVYPGCVGAVALESDSDKRGTRLSYRDWTWRS